MKREDIRAFHKRYGAVIAFAIFFIAVVVFIATAGNKNRGYEAHYVKGQQELEMNGDSYVLINDVTSESFIGSMVSDELKAERAEKVGTVTSWKVLTIATIYRVKNDETGVLLVDSRGRIYAEKTQAEELEQQIADGSCFQVYTMTASADGKTLQSVSQEMAEGLLAFQKEAKPKDGIAINEAKVSEDFTNRRILFEAAKDHALYRAVTELFLYNGRVYLTVEFSDGSEEKKASVLTGVLLPQELETYYKNMWDQQ